MNLINKATTTVAACTFALAAGSAQAADWSTTEVQFQYGDLQKAFQGGGSASETGGTSIVTLQHASGWKYGDNFFFFDYLNYGTTDVDKVNGDSGGSELYGEWYSNFSLGKMTGNDVSFLFVKDMGIIAGFNFAPEVNTHYYLPGVRFALDLPGFAFANLDVTAYIQDSTSDLGGGFGFKEDNSYMIDFNWALPFKIGSTSWSLEGHVEYIDGADSVAVQRGVGELFDSKRESWVLAQPQLRLDLGEILYGAEGQLFVGIEYQYWNNKLGDKDTDESVVQALAVWRF
jgi:nucleoside-specific outer membrane channel protein Tsx